MPRPADHTQRRADFLTALARTANVGQAFRDAGVSGCWAYRQRKRDPDFAARWQTALATGRRRLAALERDGKAPDAEFPAGMIVTGTSGNGTLQLQRQKRSTFGTSKRARFIDGLRATCNVTATARATGVSTKTAYKAYHTAAPFRAAWDAALAEGRVHLEMALIGAARGLFEGADARSGSELPPAIPRQRGALSARCARSEGGDELPIQTPEITGMDARVAVQLLRLHHPRDARGRLRGIRVKPADAESVRREILAKVAAVKAARGRGLGAASPTRSD